MDSTDNCDKDNHYSPSDNDFGALILSVRRSDKARIRNASEMLVEVDKSIVKLKC